MALTEPQIRLYPPEIKFLQKQKRKTTKNCPLKLRY